MKTFLIDDYKTFLKMQWLSSDTVEFYIDYLQRFITYSKLECINDFNNSLKIKMCYNRLFNKELKNSTFDKFRKAIIKYYYFLIDIEVCTSNYWNNLTKTKIQKNLPSSLSEEEINKILDCILWDSFQNEFVKNRAYMMFNTLLYTWIRKRELIHLKKKNITPKSIKIENWKWQKDRIIYISKIFSKLLQDYVELQNKNNEYVFCNFNGTKLSEWAIDRVFWIITKKTWIRVYPHLLRHTYASICVKKWINIYTLQQQMWHTDLKTTSIYLYLNSKENWEEMQKLNF